MIRYYLPQLIFTGVFFAAALPVLYYYYRKNPNPRCRPTFGEMTMVTLFALLICGGMGYGIGMLFKSENDGSSMRKKPNEGTGRPSSRPPAPNQTPPKKDRDRKEDRNLEEAEPPSRR